MDDIVARALARWPHVPACRGWLGLDSRGVWYLRDEATQKQGPFPSAKGSRLEHAGLLDFIGRNYQPDEAGQWYFQNGPQQVYVELAATPWVWRVDQWGNMISQTGSSVTAREILSDEQGRLYVNSAVGLGLVHSVDMPVAAELLEQGIWNGPELVRAPTLPERFGYVQSPLEHANRA